MMIPFSKSPSRIPGCAGCLRTAPVVGPAAMAALIALPSACETATGGMPTGAVVIEAVRIGGAAALLCATMTALAPRDCPVCTRSRYEQAVVPPSTTAIQGGAGRVAG